MNPYTIEISQIEHQIHLEKRRCEIIQLVTPNENARKDLDYLIRMFKNSNVEINKKRKQKYGIPK